MSKILVVDDDFTQRDLYADLFTSAGFEVTTADDGQDALEKSATHHPDLLFTGISMPRLTGFELIEKLRSNKIMESLPVVIFSHLNRDTDRQQARTLPNVQFKVQGYDSPAEILKSVRETLETRFRGYVAPIPSDDDDRPPGITL